MGNGNTRGLPDEGELAPNGTICITVDEGRRMLLAFAEQAVHPDDWIWVLTSLRSFNVTDPVISEPLWVADIDLWEIPLDTP